jgi:hypothetical protein
MDVVRGNIGVPSQAWDQQHELVEVSSFSRLAQARSIIDIQMHAIKKIATRSNF